MTKTLNTSNLKCALRCSPVSAPLQKQPCQPPPSTFKRTCTLFLPTLQMPDKHWPPCGSWSTSRSAAPGLGVGLAKSLALRQGAPLAQPQDLPVCQEWGEGLTGLWSALRWPHQQPCAPVMAETQTLQA